MEGMKELGGEEHGYLMSSSHKPQSARRHRRKTFCCLAIALFISMCVGLGLGLGLGYGLSHNKDEGHSTDSGSSRIYERAAVATDAAPCSEVGMNILNRDGSAVDAAIASLLCIGVINFHSTGIGGGGFMIYYNATSKTATVLDYRETAPGRANSSMYDRFDPDEEAFSYGVFTISSWRYIA